MKRIVLALLLFASACDPVSRLQKQMTKNEQTKAAAAKLCADLFPIANIQFIPGDIDTAALVDHIMSLCPVVRDSVIHDTLLREPIVKSINKDTLIGTIKKFIKPDTLKIKDIGIITSLQGQLKAKTEETNKLSSMNTVLQISSNKYKSESATRLWMFISALLLLVLTNGAWLYGKFKKVIPVIVFLCLGGSAMAQKVDTVIDMGIYRSHYSYALKQPLYVEYLLFRGGGDCPRDAFRFINSGLADEAKANDYKFNGYDEGHLANAEDFAGNCADEELTFRFINCLPQSPKLNRGIWKTWETKIRQESQKERLFIICGGQFGKKKIGNKVAVPDYCWKIVEDHKGTVMHVLWFPNDDSDSVQEITLDELYKKLTYKIEL